MNRNFFDIQKIFLPKINAKMTASTYTPGDNVSDISLLDSIL